jgi:hypothetical protein
LNIIKGKIKLSNNRHITVVVVILQYWVIEIERKVAVVIFFETNVQIEGREGICHCAVDVEGEKLSHVVY